MGIFTTLFGCEKGERRFVTEEKFQENLEKQTSMSPQTLRKLRDYNVSDQTMLKLEFFFYTDSSERAKALSSSLEETGYSSEFGKSAGDKKIFLITGWTSPIRMSEELVVNWTRDMCEIGFDHDSEFDGWGTNPKQD